MKIAILAGGVGGARMARGFLAHDSVETTVIVNVGDDERVYGIALSPDIDTIIYTLAGQEGEFGWGRVDDTWNVMGELSRFDLDTSFRLGDSDLAMNLYRTDQIHLGRTLSEITAAQAAAFDVPLTVLPVTDDELRTRIQVDATGAWLDFQTYFVRRGHQDRVRAISYSGAEAALPAPGVIEAIDTADAVVIAPSNPILSIEPILAVPGIREAVAGRVVMGVSPFIGGDAVKGPAAELMRALGHDPDPDGLHSFYGGLLDHLVVDVGDDRHIEGLEMHATDIMIGTWARASALAEEIVAWLH